MAMPHFLIPDDAFNRQLLDQVHPPAWVNPTPSGPYNLVVVGGGTAGLVSAAGAAGLGAKVALVEKNLLGGDCLNFGCVPSKALLRSARLVGEMRKAPSLGLSVAEQTVDFSAIMARLRRVRAGMAHHDSAERFQKLGIDVFFGEGQFTGPKTLRVGESSLEFSRAILATGARPTFPDIPGLAPGHFQTNETLFDLTSLPQRWVVLGGGPIGCEMAQAMAHFGAEVHLVERGERLLPREEPEAAQIVEDSLRRDGVVFHFQSQVNKGEIKGSKKVIHLESKGNSLSLETDEVLVAVGRSPNLVGLNLEAAGVHHDPRQGVIINDYLRTSNSRIWAAGDVCSRFQFTHAADAMARIAIQNSLFWGKARVSRLVIPWCTYTEPEIAHVGLGENEAREQGIAWIPYRVDLAQVDRAILDGESEGYIRIMARRGSDQIIGATVVGANAGELIGTIALAMAHKLGLKALSKSIFPYPTYSEGLKKAGDAYNRGRLTPWLKKMLAQILAWRR